MNSLQVNQEEVDVEALKYLNRLSDFLFTLARYAAKLDNVEETIYIRPNPSFKIYKPVEDTDAWKKSKDQKLKPIPIKVSYTVVKRLISKFRKNKISVWF